MNIQKNIIKYCFVVLMIMLDGFLFAQTGQILFKNSISKNYNQANGLPQNQINSFCFDNIGYLWIGTMGGLSRFDGQVFKNQFGNKSTIPTKARVLQFIKKSADTLFALTSESSLFVITNGDVVSFEKYSVKKHGILFQNSQTSVPAFDDLPDTSLERYSATHSWAYQYYNLGFKWGRDSFAIMGKILSVFTKKGLVKSFYLPKHNESEYHLSELYLLGHDVAVLNKKKNCLDLYSVDSNVRHLPFPMRNSNPWRLYRSVDNKVLYAANGFRLFEVQSGEFVSGTTFTQIMDDFNDSIKVFSIYNLDNKYLIFGTYNKGLYIYHSQSIRTFTSPDKSSKSHIFYAQTLMPDSASILTGVNLLFDKNGFKRKLKEQYKKDEIEILSAGKFELLNRAIFKDKSGKYWYNTFLNKNNFTYSIIKASDPEGAEKMIMMNNVISTIRSFFEDKNGNVWVAIDSTIGYFEKGTNKFHIVVNDIKNKLDIAGNVFCFFEDAKGYLLIGTLNGLYRLDIKNEGSYPQKYLLDGTEIRFLTLDKQNGSIWIGTYGKGMWILKQSGELIQLPMDKEQNLSNVHYVVTDQQERVWLSTNNGLYVTTKKNIDDFEANPAINPYYYRFSVFDGLASSEFNGGCQLPMILQSNGDLTVSSMAGLAWLNTNEVSIEFSSKTIQASIVQGENTLSPSIQSLKIEADDNRPIKINVYAPDWNQSYNIQLQYNIIKKGEEGSEWKDLGENQISFPFLSTGNYEIKIRKRIGLNNTDFKYYTVKLEKDPFWYETNLLYLVLLSIFFVIAYLINNYRLLSIKRKNRILTEKVSIASENLNEANKELSKTVETKDSLILLFNNDLSKPLHDINNLAQSLASEKDIEEPFASDVKLLANSTQDLEELMNDMLLWTEVQRENATIRLEYKQINLMELLEKNFELFRFRLEQNIITEKILIPPGTMIFTDRKILNSILYNLITNAIKYTVNGVIQIERFSDDDGDSRFSLFVRSKSNTHSIPALTLKPDGSSYREIYEAVKNSIVDDSVQSRHIGLQLVKSFSEMLGIRVSYDNTFEDIFTVRISGLK